MHSMMEPLETNQYREENRVETDEENIQYRMGTCRILTYLYFCPTSGYVLMLKGCGATMLNYYQCSICCVFIV